MDSLLPVLIILILIFLNGLFVAAEFAMVGVPRTRIERLAAQGHRMARLVQPILHDPRRQDRYIATAQLGITGASLGLGMYGEHILAGWLAHLLESFGTARWIAAHGVASVLAIAVLTYFHIVLGEMVPKSLALLSAERTALWITPPIRWIQFLLYPLVIGLNAIGNGILRLMGIQREFSATHYHTPEELEYLVKESEAGGLLRAETGKVLRDLFEFGELTAGEIMVPRVRVQGLPIDASAEQIAAIVHASHHTQYPVYEGDLDHILGVIHIKDILRLALAGKTFKENGIRQAPYVPETADLDTVLTTMRQAHVQMAVVMDEHGGTAGIISLEDLFEEVVGDIEEGITHPPDISRDTEGRLRVIGTVRLDEVGDALGVTFEHEEVDTVSGLVLMLLDRPPAVGDVVTYDRLRFEVVTVEGRGVGACLVSIETPSGITE
ncbi:MAG: hemolysin family protein [Alphaproteobacteria bacterium]|uniref:Hemolysin family protein n=1 Tax=Candidatus Nitrobium versatile TaxID=2884831 RepID=A0A953J7E0_9BACT|nr:hemolysin family protein [Candidatus Nitrobium versatile]